MFKFMVLIKKKPSMTRAEFIDYYENVHAPLLQRIMPPIGTYRRNYIQYNDELGSTIGRGGGSGETPFDVITEVIFETREQADTYMSAFWDEERHRQILEDESNFVSGNGGVVYVVDTYESEKST